MYAEQTEMYKKEMERYLNKTISLEKELEKLVTNYNKEISTLKAEHAAEISKLNKTIQSLQEQLDKKSEQLCDTKERLCSAIGVYISLII